MNHQEKTLDISKVLINQEDLGSELPVSAMLAKSAVPYSHRRLADNYVIMKKIYGFQVVQPRILNIEKHLLFKYKMNTLECTTINQMNIELALLKKWATSLNEEVRNDSDQLLQIRIKELKFILSNIYARVSNEVFNGYKALNCYLEEVTKYYSMS